MSNYIIVAYLFGFILGAALATVIFFRTVHATLQVDQSNEEKDMYRFVVHVPIDELPKKKYLIVKVKHKDLYTTGQNEMLNELIKNEDQNYF